MEIHAPFDGLAKGITIGVTTMLVGSLLLLEPGLLLPKDDATRDVDLWLRIAQLSVPVVMGLTWLWHPRRCVWTGSAVVVERPIGRVEIPMEEVQRVREIQPKMSKILRAFGSGGYFGYFGKFWSKDLGTVSLHARSRTVPWLLLTLKNGKTHGLALSEEGRQTVADALAHLHIERETS